MLYSVNRQERHFSGQRHGNSISVDSTICWPSHVAIDVSESRMGLFSIVTRTIAAYCSAAVNGSQLGLSKLHG